MSEQVKLYCRRRSLGTPMVGLGNLPDEALHHVLSFLPLQEAVQTCMLARRWRHLWRSMSTLRVTSGSQSKRITDQGFHDLNIFVNNFLLRRDCNAPLQLCDFLIYPPGSVYSTEDEAAQIRDDQAAQISFWIQRALLCKAQILRVRYGYDEYYFTIDILRLNSQHLTTLELEHVSLESGFLDLSNCTSLKTVWMKFCIIDSDEISSQSLKELTMIECTFQRSNRIRICTPSLVLLELTDNCEQTPLLESMPSLVKAFVRVHDSVGDYCDKEEFGGSCDNNSCNNCGDFGEKSQKCVLLNGLSQAESLELVAGPRMFIFKRDLMWCPTFSKLKTLLLNEWCVAVDFRGLICFLQHAPVLEKLTLQLRQAPDNWGRPGGLYIPSKAQFASKKLKVIEIKCEDFDRRVHQISRKLSIYNTYLEQINIQCSNRCSECYSWQKNSDIPRHISEY